MPRPILATISTSALSHNLAQVRARIEQKRQLTQGLSTANAQVCAVIKANAYGHGTLAAVRGFAGADSLGMIDIADLVLCREAGWTKPLFLLEGFFEKSDIAILQNYQMTTAIHSDEQIALLSAAEVGKPIDVFLKFNTGMNRLGFLPVQAASRLAQLQQLQQEGKVGTIGHMMHFANADLELSHVQSAYQLILQARADYSGPLSICNSAAVLRFPELALAAPENWVRPGICLYGSLPFATNLHDCDPLEFKPAMTLSAQIIAVQNLQAGESVGYGSTFTAERAIRIGVVACGYADGYPRSAPNGTPVTIEGVASQLVGRVSMDMLTVDLSHLPQAGLGSTVVLWGEAGPSIDKIAEKSGRIGYELMCGLTKRVPVQVV